MKKFYFALLAMIIAATAFSADAATVYFKNTVSWETVKVHYWGSSNTDWPGNAGTLVEGTTDVWSFNLPEGTTGLVFNNNGAGEQTVDVTEIVDGHIYTPTGANKYGVTHTEYTPGEQPEQPEQPEVELPDLYLIGAHCSWSFNEAAAYKFTANKENKTYTLKLDSFSKDTQFKVAGNGFNPEYTVAGVLKVNSEFVNVSNIGGENSNTTISANLTDVTFTFVYVSDSEGKLKVEGTAEQVVDPEPTGLEFYVRGEVNGWGTGDDYKFKLVSGDDYKLTLTTLSGEFKLGAATWSDFNYGGAGSVVVDTEYTLTFEGGNMSVSEPLENVTLHFNVKTHVFKMTVPAPTPVEDQLYTVYFKNSENWENVHAYAWVHGGEEVDENHILGAYPGTLMHNPVVVNGEEYFAISFKANPTRLYDILFNNGSEEVKAGDFSVVNKGIYTNEGHTGNIHEGAAVAVSSLSEGIVVAQGNISGETTEKTFKLSVTALPHHTAHYVVIPESAASLAPAREGAEYTAVENGEIELPTGAGTIQFYSHDGEKFSQPTTYSYNIALDTTGIEGVEVENGAAAEYFNLQGVRVANPTEGLYIVRRGNTVTKQYIR